ncbi:hypothetical protein KAFR_0A03680 [Kazachstania africana CBS 2517]|uniref:Uncharacterized protein n=1 Tax=Kazachstania africana (strain ATCC 22294 / BCRC 22015 / CBS 2517 / CECT 1963 / NBRC 1671 / NRRL Y-8276) TaxID=1071382 RepID=H2AN53_KAZAF|nr:hypothetical protein KAFR_0A03680 [Kazachstania africana CBS 2517]CCF55803.1 hypothetical protein KAFR_0A03680 [Kazachstania africana CBS 2517]
MSKKQDYIAKIRYENNLPPPTVPPKLLNYQINPDEDVDSPQLITSLYTRTNVTPLVDINGDLGMPMDLMEIPGLLNKNDTRYLYSFDNVKLDPKDRILLRDPRVDRLTKTDMSKVKFLRRTEYVSSTIAASNTKKRPRNRLEDDDDKVLNPAEIVTRVENTFEAMTDDLSKLRHPVKRHLKATKVWNLIPDTASMDQNYFTLKLVGSAALDKREKEALALKTTIFRPVELEEDEWMSMYTTDMKDSETLEKSIERVIDENLTADDSNKVFRFRRLRDFDMKQAKSTDSSLSELAIVLNNEKGVAYYKPLRTRIELRRRRVNDVIKPLVTEHNIDQLNISLRNPTTSEVNTRDRLRMKFDPINFVPVDEEEEEKEEESREDDMSKEKHDDNEQHKHEDLDSTQNQITGKADSKEDEVEKATQHQDSQENSSQKADNGQMQEEPENKQEDSSTKDFEKESSEDTVSEKEEVVTL